MKKPKVLFLDIETFYLVLRGWGLYDQNYGLNQVEADWTVASWAAKWLGSDKMLYQDVSGQKNLRDDKKILKGIWELLDAADIIVTQNGKKFDAKKLNARFIINGMKPPRPYQHIDTRQLARKHFGFTSNSLEYLTDKLCVKYKKLKHKEFPGMELWSRCLQDDKRAWAEMKLYNTHDVLALEEVYHKLAPWDSSVDFNVYRDAGVACNCGSVRLKKEGFHYTKGGKFQQFSCKECGRWTTARGEKNNLLSKERRDEIRKASK